MDRELESRWLAAAAQLLRFAGLWPATDAVAVVGWVARISARTPPALRPGGAGGQGDEILPGRFSTCLVM